MFVRFMSDLHNEFGTLTVPRKENEKETVLILAGDIGVAKKKHTFVMFLAEMLERFRAVVYVMGNHEHYSGGSLIRSADKIEESMQEDGFDTSNLYVLEKTYIEIDDVVFIGATMWSNFQNHNWLVMNDCQMFMNDYKQIRTGSIGVPYQRSITASDIIREHQLSVSFIFDHVAKFKEAGKRIVVVTHHGPSWQSISEAYRGSPVNGAYVSDLEEDIINTKPDFWIHGHVHSSFDYMIEDTRVLTNPRGYYPSEINSRFDPLKEFEV